MDPQFVQPPVDPDPEPTPETLGKPGRRGAYARAALVILGAVTAFLFLGAAASRAGGGNAGEAGMAFAIEGAMCGAPVWLVALVLAGLSLDLRAIVPALVAPFVWMAMVTVLFG